MALNNKIIAYEAFYTNIKQNRNIIRIKIHKTVFFYLFFFIIKDYLRSPNYMLRKIFK